MSKFKIPVPPRSSNKTIRFPNDVINRVEAHLVNTDCTFSAFVVAAVRKALDDLDNPESEEN